MTNINIYFVSLPIDENTNVTDNGPHVPYATCDVSEAQG
jgi:hypothetical protein